MRKSKDEKRINNINDAYRSCLEDYVIRFYEL